ncbi:carbohydrate-binding domain-containing protein [Ruminococcus sp. HUN007]|uniref:carbohydrate-binding domain-containing protein n=1 Tax=Ruminococcus sp. HUN007 TaxID=1514668 RepID=UPI0005D23AA9|nr:carbohydrate-binding domain-containing protein [Ruminococcus sp. HUN007]
MKKFLSRTAAGLAALTICASFSAVPAGAAEEVLKGDVDGNEVVSTADLVALSAHILGSKTIDEKLKANADMNDNNEINVIDFILLKNVFMGTPAAESLKISLEGDSVKADEGVTVEGTKATITKSGTYLISGKMTSEAQIIVNTAETDTESVNITLSDVTMTNSSDTPCIMVENADKTKITFNGTNVLTGTADTAEAATAVIYAKDDLTFTKNSAGTLEINSGAQMGIYCNNDVKFNGGTIKIKTDAAGTGTAKADAVKAKGNVEIGGGDIDVNAAGDGIKSSKNAVVISDGKAEIKSGKDAVQGETAVTITGGEIVASGDRGITVSAGNLTIGGGTLLATSTEAVDYSNVVIGENFSNSNIIALALNEQHNKSEVLTIAGKEFTAAKKYQYIFATYPDLAASSANVLLIDGKKAEFTVVPVGK